MHPRELFSGFYAVLHISESCAPVSRLLSQYSCDDSEFAHGLMPARVHASMHAPSMRWRSTLSAKRSIVCTCINAARGSVSSQGRVCAGETQLCRIKADEHVVARQHACGDGERGRAHMCQGVRGGCICPAAPACAPSISSPGVRRRQCTRRNSAQKS